MDRREFLTVSGGLAVSVAGLGEALAADPLRFELPSIPAQFRNMWPEDWERAFQKRARHAIESLVKERIAGGTAGENEKNYYPRAMSHRLAGNAKDGLAALQAEDADGKRDHEHTEGIDFYWCFTLKGQVRKYFLFGDQLEPAYRKRMLAGAKAWTAEDPQAVRRAGRTLRLEAVVQVLEARRQGRAEVLRDAVPRQDVPDG